MSLFSKKDIERVIPHRGDMLLVDEIRECDEKHGIGIHFVRDNEFWCAGHFPGNPIMPGVLQIEALAQTACFVAFKCLGTAVEDNMGYFTNIDKVRFSKMVKPGDVLELHIELLGQKMNFYKFHGIAKVDGEQVSEATFAALMEVKK